MSCNKKHATSVSRTRDIIARLFAAGNAKPPSLTAWPSAATAAIAAGSAPIWSRLLAWRRCIA